jgi:hypothetical protein
MMLNMVVHIPIKIAMNGVHVNRAAIQPVVEHVFLKTGMLG